MKTDLPLTTAGPTALNNSSGTTRWLKAARRASGDTSMAVTAWR